METINYSVPVNLPSTDDFASRFPQYGGYVRGEGKHLFKELITPENFISAREATKLGHPAVAGVAKICRDIFNEQQLPEERWGFYKQFIGAVICSLMEANGFDKTGTKKSVPQDFWTKGEFYRKKNS